MPDWGPHPVNWYEIIQTTQISQFHSHAEWRKQVYASYIHTCIYIIYICILLPYSQRHLCSSLTALKWYGKQGFMNTVLIVIHVHLKYTLFLYIKMFLYIKNVIVCVFFHSSNKKWNLEGSYAFHKKPPRRSKIWDMGYSGRHRVHMNFQPSPPLPHMLQLLPRF